MKDNFFMGHEQDQSVAVYELGSGGEAPDWVVKVARETGIDLRNLRRRKGVQRDLSGYVDGYGIDQAMRYLEMAGITSEMLENLDNRISRIEGNDRGEIKVPLRLIAVAGTLGSGKSTVAELLREAGQQQGLAVLHYPEQWEDNAFLKSFNKEWAKWFKMGGDKSLDFDEGKNLADLQHKSQLWFLASKMIRYLQAADDLRNNPEARVVVEPPIREDWVYNRTQEDELEMSANYDSALAYERIFGVFCELLPREVENEIYVYNCVPFTNVWTRIMNVRGRSFEANIPRGYVEALHRNTSKLQVDKYKSGQGRVLFVDGGNHNLTRENNNRLEMGRVIWERILNGG